MAAPGRSIPVLLNATTRTGKSSLPFNELKDQTPSITASAFTSALSQAANGVSIVTTIHDDVNAGLTVSSMCSVCADPALLLVCVNSDNVFCKMADASGRFAVNILPSSCVELATVFAGLNEELNENRFSTGVWTTLTTGAPILSDALIALDLSLIHI